MLRRMQAGGQRTVLLVVRGSTAASELMALELRQEQKLLALTAGRRRACKQMASRCADSHAAVRRVAADWHVFGARAPVRGKSATISGDATPWSSDVTFSPPRCSIRGR